MFVVSEEFLCFWTLKILTWLQFYMLWRHWAPGRGFFLGLLLNKYIRVFMHVCVCRSACLSLYPLWLIQIPSDDEVLSGCFLAPAQPTLRKVCTWRQNTGGQSNILALTLHTASLLLEYHFLKLTNTHGQKLASGCSLGCGWNSSSDCLLWQPTRGS